MGKHDDGRNGGNRDDIDVTGLYGEHGPKHSCGDCPTTRIAHAVWSRQLADLNHWAELQAQIVANRELREEHHKLWMNELRAGSEHMQKLMDGHGKRLDEMETLLARIAEKVGA